MYFLASNNCSYFNIEYCNKSLINGSICFPAALNSYCIRELSFLCWLFVFFKNG